MSDFFAALPHREIQEVFPDVFFVTGTMQAEFFDSPWQFSRNMTIVREGSSLTIINSVRLNDEGLAALEALGTVEHIVRIGSLHGIDDPFYVDRYPNATYWSVRNMDHDGLPPRDQELAAGSLPFGQATWFEFENTNLPEGILILEREGGIAIACDALQNWTAPDEFFSDETRGTMTEMGFFVPANVGPVWIQVNEPKVDDFHRLGQYSFEHALCGHGEPLIGGASGKYADTVGKIFAGDG